MIREEFFEINWINISGFRRVCTVYKCMWGKKNQSFRKSQKSMFLLRHHRHPGPGATSAISRVELQSETSLCLFTICSTIIAKAIIVEQRFFTNKNNNWPRQHYRRHTVGTMYIVQPQPQEKLCTWSCTHIAQILQGSAKHCAQVQCTSSQLTWHMVVHTHTLYL